jgi:hypothetical protein
MEESVMRPAIFIAPLFALVAACSSSDGGGTGGGTNPHSQTPNSLEPSDGSAPLPTIAIAIQGKGAVVSRDARVNCTSDGSTTTGTCSTYYEETLYAEAASGWSFSHWDPAVSDTSALLLTVASPTAVTAVFKQD